MDILMPAIMAGNKWTPKSLTNLELWYAADKITGLSDGAAVAQWDDLSGNNRHATQGTSGKRPTYKTNILNSEPVVRFSFASSTSLLVTLASTISQPNTVFVVWSGYSNGTYLRALGSNSDGSGSPNLHHYNNKIGFTAGNTIEYSKTLPFSHLITTGVTNGANSVVYENGLSKTTGNAGAYGWGSFRIGAFWTETGFLNGDIAEVIFYSAALSTADRQRVEKYLSGKYGIAVAA